jgi:hypothetical protein
MRDILAAKFRGISLGSSYCGPHASLSHDEAVALFRDGLIADLLHLPPGHRTLHAHRPSESPAFWIAHAIRPNKSSFTATRVLTLLTKSG